MAKLRMLGPFDLNEETIDEKIDMVTPGSYILGMLDDEGHFVAHYVGRSDYDVRGEIRRYANRYRSFKFCGAMTAQEAFENECHCYHDFGGKGVLDNGLHPSRAGGSQWKCPRCAVFG